MSFLIFLLMSCSNNSKSENDQKKLTNQDQNLQMTNQQSELLSSQTVDQQVPAQAMEIEISNSQTNNQEHITNNQQPIDRIESGDTTNAYKVLYDQNFFQKLRQIYPVLSISDFQKDIVYNQLDALSIILSEEGYIKRYIKKNDNRSYVASQITKNYIRKNIKNKRSYIFLLKNNQILFYLIPEFGRYYEEEEVIRMLERGEGIVMKLEKITRKKKVIQKVTS